MDWIRTLAPTRTDPREFRLLGPDAERLRNACGPNAVAWGAQLGEDVIAKAAREVTVLGGSASLTEALRAATTSTTLRMLTIIAGCADPDASVVTTEAVTGTRDLARRGLKISDFAHTIRYGHSILYAAFFDAVSAVAPSSGAHEELRRVSLLLFKLIDEFIGAMTDVFLEEQNVWGASRSAAQLEMVRQIVDGAAVSTADARRLLEYPLGADHVAVIAWRTAPGHDTADSLRVAVEPVLQCWGITQASLLVPVGSNTLWAWGAFEPGSTPKKKTPVPEFEGTMVGVGQAGHGISGFRHSHLEARAVERLLRHGPERSRSSLAHQDIDLDALLLVDREAARQFVERHLGRLGADDPGMARLRGTLRRYLDTDRSLSQVAALENISRNTVTYRVKQAFDLCEHVSDTPTLKIRAALAVVEWLLDPSS